jgi:hypothetical protein
MPNTMSTATAESATRSSTGSVNLDWLVSVDDHILEPPNLWVDRVARKDRERAPHMETDTDGQEIWVYDGKRFPTPGLSAVAGKSKEEFSPEPLPYSEMRPGCIDVVKRQIGHLDPTVQYKILRGNAERLYRFTPAESPARGEHA